MLITKHFLFLHLPKTGGEFLKMLCDKHLADQIEEHGVYKHGGEVLIPDEFLHLPRFALIRNPWDWYVSWYHYLKQAGENVDYPEWWEVTNNGQNDFKTTITNLCHGRVENSNADLAKRMKLRDVGLLSMHHNDMLGNSIAEDKITVGKTENLRVDFLGFLEAIKMEIPFMLLHALRNAPAVNLSDRKKKYHEYYDQELADLVAQKDKAIIERYQYEF